MEFLKIIFPFLKNYKSKKERKKEIVFDSLILLQGRKVSIFQGAKGLHIVPRSLGYQDACYVLGRVEKTQNMVEASSINMYPPIKRKLTLSQISEVAKQ